MGDKEAFILLHASFLTLLHLSTPVCRCCAVSDDDDDDIVPKGRLLEDYHRLALHTERQLRGEAR